MATDDLVYLSAIELRTRFRSRGFHRSNVTEAILARIERLNPGLGAFVTVTGSLARNRPKPPNSPTRTATWAS